MRNLSVLGEHYALLCDMYTFYLKIRRLYVKCEFDALHVKQHGHMGPKGPGPALGPHVFSHEAHKFHKKKLFNSLERLCGAGGETVTKNMFYGCV